MKTLSQIYSLATRKMEPLAVASLPQELFMENMTETGWESLLAVQHGRVVNSNMV
jgi:hypothetical protein